jgi:hypothetical protein
MVLTMVYLHSELLSFWTLPIVWYYNKHVSEAGGVSVLRWGDERHLLCWLRQKEPTPVTGSAISNGRNGVGVSHPITWGRKQIQFPKPFLQNTERWTKSYDSVIPQASSPEILSPHLHSGTEEIHEKPVSWSRSGNFNPKHSEYFNATFDNDHLKTRRIVCVPTFRHTLGWQFLK